MTKNHPKHSANSDIDRSATDIIHTDLAGRRILLVVSGSIAVFKACLLARNLVSAGVDLRVLMTDSATWFVQPLSFQFISHHPVYRNNLEDESMHGIDHIQLAKWAELIVIAPISANRISRLALGLADDMLGTCILASAAPVLIAPAMNQQMWGQSVVQQHLDSLKSRGWHLAEPDSGAQACGDVGPGRMMEVDKLMNLVSRICGQGESAQGIKASNQVSIAPSLTTPAQTSSNATTGGLKALITMGATEELIDPVRFISNRSSGKMGLSLFETLHACGVDTHAVTASISAPVQWRKDRLGLNDRFTTVRSAEQMLAAVLEQINALKPDIFIGVAAVSDYRPTQCSKRKMSSSAKHLQLDLERTPDIIATVKKMFPDLYCVAFAAQTHDLLTLGQEKLKAKGVDMVVVNSVGSEQMDSLAGADIRCIILRPDTQRDLGCLSKSAFSALLVEEILAQLDSRSSARPHASGA